MYPNNFHSNFLTGHIHVNKSSRSSATSACAKLSPCLCTWLSRIVFTSGHSYQLQQQQRQSSGCKRISRRFHRANGRRNLPGPDVPDAYTYVEMGSSHYSYPSLGSQEFLLIDGAEEVDALARVTGAPSPSHLEELLMGSSSPSHTAASPAAQEAPQHGHMPAACRTQPRTCAGRPRRKSRVHGRDPNPNGRSIAGRLRLEAAVDEQAQASAMAILTAVFLSLCGTLNKQRPGIAAGDQSGHDEAGPGRNQTAARSSETPIEAGSRLQASVRNADLEGGTSRSCSPQHQQKSRVCLSGRLLHDDTDNVNVEDADTFSDKDFGSDETRVAAADDASWKEDGGCHRSSKATPEPAPEGADHSPSKRLRLDPELNGHGGSPVNLLPKSDSDVNVVLLSPAVSPVDRRLAGGSPSALRPAAWMAPVTAPTQVPFTCSPNTTSFV